MWRSPRRVDCAQTTAFPSPPLDDVRKLQAALAPIATRAKGLAWAKKRPWTVVSHVGWSAGAPTIDLHDLNAKLAKSTAETLIRVAPELKSGAVFLVVGRGKHSRGSPVLGKVVRATLKPGCDTHGWSLRSPSASRIALILDRSKAPASATGALGWGFWLWMLLVALAAGVALLRNCG